MLGFAAVSELPLSTLPGAGAAGAISALDVRVLAQPRRRNLPLFKSLADLEREKAARRPAAPSPAVEKREVAPKRQPKPSPLLRALLPRIDLPEPGTPRETVLDKASAAIARAAEKAAVDAREGAERDRRAAEERQAEAERLRLAEEAEADGARQEHARRRAAADRRARRMAAAKLARESAQSATRAALAAMFRHHAAVERLADLLSEDPVDQVAVRRARQQERRARADVRRATAEDRTLIEVAAVLRLRQKLERVRGQLLGALEAAATDSRRRTKQQTENVLAAIASLSALEDD